MVPRDAPDLAEAAAVEDRPRAEAGQAGPRAGEGLGVCVQSEHAHVIRRPFEHRLGVSAHADRPIDHPALAAGPQEEQRFVEHHRDVNRYTPMLDSLSNTDGSSP